MTEVSVIGLGAMGSALANALLDKGRAVTVWNRTIEKAAPLIGKGAIAAATSVDAVSASPLVLVCVDNYAASMSILQNSADVLADRTIIQLTSDTGTRAEEMSAWMTERGAHYLDGVILAYPSDIGSDEAAILVAGRATVWEIGESVLRDLAGGATYVGDNVRVPSTLSAALISPLMGAILGAIQAAVLCEADGFPIADYAAMSGALSPVLIGQLEHTLATIADGRFEAPEAALATYASSIADRTAESQARGINVEFYEFVNDLLARATRAGLGDQELSAIIKLWQ